MCSLSAQKKDGNVYKRRKMDKDSNSLAAYEEAKESTIQSCTTSKDHSSLLKPIVPSETMVLSSKADTTDLILDIEEPTEVPSEPSSDMNDKCLVSTEKKDAAECSSSNISPIEPITELTSLKDLCIAILKENGVITESRTRITEEEFTDANPLLACNTCGAMEHLLKMLMCDSCEAAFHLSCCIPGIKELPANEWFCNTCYLKKPKRVYGKQREGKVKPSANTNQKPHGMSHIEYMLKDTEQYVSGARIGIGFQADVPEWSGPTSRYDILSHGFPAGHLYLLFSQMTGIVLVVFFGIQPVLIVLFHSSCPNMPPNLSLARPRHCCCLPHQPLPHPPPSPEPAAICLLLLLLPTILPLAATFFLMTPPPPILPIVSLSRLALPPPRRTAAATPQTPFYQRRPAVPSPQRRPTHMQPPLHAPHLSLSYRSKAPTGWPKQKAYVNSRIIVVIPDVI
ncbi:hypothetical protein PR202_gb01336 [Eleusine coracana subsp. coracana]|uniref:PHD-type domain-containing protein n=1 Tax=Eleusine coracana subsp. coracana TaxID=191504 RepID=A0AAV5DW18_ELECO|nr:hypothetical protein PR202_gb01336 [Eleusine coracana subsp. coracana]